MDSEMKKLRDENEDSKLIELLKNDYKLLTESASRKQKE